MLRRSKGLRLLTLASLCGVLLGAGPSWASLATIERDWGSVVFALDSRLRFEALDWFDPGEADSSADASQTFGASRVRLRTSVLTRQAEFVLELQDTRIFGLSRNSIAAAPAGALGPGGVYFANTRQTDQGEVLVNLFFARWRRRGFAIAIGRQLYASGSESGTLHPRLARLKGMRVSQRLIGPFGFTHVGRSFDGVVASFDRPSWNATSFALRPRHGGFEISGNRQIEDITLVGASLGLKRFPRVNAPVDAALFWIYYQDQRNSPLKTDNRDRSRRRADEKSLRIHSFGGHTLALLERPRGDIDLMAWGVGQVGDWGEQRHRGWAWALEAGWQPRRWQWQPWFRVGWNRSSGDDDPDDDRHRTMFQMLPTARIYARFPFFNLMNNDDVFLQLLLSPHDRIDLRMDWHRLRLTESSDLWYAGGGATNDDVFGFSGIPTGGNRDLGDLLDLSVSWSLASEWNLSLYAGQVFGGAAVSTAFADRDGSYGFLEVSWKP